MRDWHIPGGSVAIVKHGRLIFAHGYGWANLGYHHKVYADNLFRIGSISKTITATTVLKLIQQNKLHLWWHPYKVLNDLKPITRRRVNPEIYAITIEDLLVMSSGWDTDGPTAPDPMFGPWTSRMRHQIHETGGITPPTCYNAARMMMTQPMQFRPGTEYSYSNLNYCLLGLIINKITHQPYGYQPYEQYVKQHILAPIGITDMKIGSDKWGKSAPKEVTYYHFDHHYHKNPDGLPYSARHTVLKDNFADGGWIASSIDLSKFFYALETGKIIDRYMLKVMHRRPHFQHRWWHYFAMGGVRHYYYPHWYWIKTGSFTGTAAIAIYESNGTAYAAVFNTSPPRKFRFLKQIRKVLTHT